MLDLQCRCEIEPYVLLQKPDQTQTTEDIPEEMYGEGLVLKSRWYRSMSRACTVHPDKPAMLQNIVFRTFHCSSACLASAWHQIRQGKLNPRSHSENGMEEQGGWQEVGRSRCYTPSSEDVGSTLKFEITPILLPTKQELAPPWTFFTGRVITPAPAPSRSRIPLAQPSDGDHRFSVLSYNLLADLYAHVRWIDNFLFFLSCFGWWGPTVA